LIICFIIIKSRCTSYTFIICECITIFKFIFINTIIIYKGGELELPVEVTHDKETVWLRAEEMADLFERDRSVIQRHIKKHIQRK